MSGKEKSETGPRKGRPIYLDYQATTPTDPRVVEAMLPFFGEKFGNPHSRNHFYGWEAEEAVENARAQVAAIIGASAKEIVFTSGATESNNLALKGIAHFYRDRRNHIVTVVTEHKCVLESCRHLEREGFRVTYLPVKADGLIDLDQLRDAITDRTSVVSVMGVNNEIGVIQPLAEIGAICRENGAFFHSDCAQAVGKIPLDVEAMTIDAMSISGHKLYGPMGIGVLYVRRRPRVRLEPMIDGGGQERGMRSGTLNVPGIVGLGRACAICGAEMGTEGARLAGLRDRLLAGLRAKVDGVVVNGSMSSRLPNNLHVSFIGVDGSALLIGIGDIAVSSGSACSSASEKPSHVLCAILGEDRVPSASIRFGLGRFTTDSDIDYAIEKFTAVVRHLREMAPV